MKKLLLALVASVAIAPTFAAEVATNQFDSNNIVCSGNRIGSNANVNDLRGRCKDFRVQHTNVTFYDENSKKVVHCKSDKSGNVTVTECKAAAV